MPFIYEEDKHKKPFSESWQDPPRRGFHVRITQATLGAIGLKVAALLGKRREQKLEKIKEARRRAHR